MKNQSGNVLFIILIAVALFAALSYAVTQDRTSVKDSSGEQQKLDQAVIDNYMTCLNQGRMTLEMARGCNTINYDPPSAWSGSNFNCHMFHPQGGGCAYQDIDFGVCGIEGAGQDATQLEIGESCGNIVYVGVSSGNRIYTTRTDLTGSYTYNNGTSNWVATGATSTTDGLVNTNILVNLSDLGAPYDAAIACRTLGAAWYLPARAELDMLYNNKSAGALNGSFDESGNQYRSSTETTTKNAYTKLFSNGGGNNGTRKHANLIVRCVRRD